MLSYQHEISFFDFQADAMTDFMVRFNWTYISLVFMEGPYGENGGKQVSKLVHTSLTLFIPLFIHLLSNYNV